MNEPMNKQLTLGSISTVMGAFPLAAIHVGMNPVWATETEPFLIRVTTKRLPEMQHYSDISELDGAELPPVDVITGGIPPFPADEAFFRFIREMRYTTNGRSPRYLIMEKAPSILTKNGGRELYEILRQLIALCENDHTEKKDVIPAMLESGMGSPSGEWIGDHGSVAWLRVEEAQAWGVAQKRSRLFSVADLNGQFAGEILAHGIMSRDVGTQNNKPDTVYTVRRFSQADICHMQGFPDDWTQHLSTEEPTEQEIAWWSGVFAEWYEIQGKRMLPTRNRIVKWLKNPSSPSAAYKAYGDTISVQCAQELLQGIVWADRAS